MVSDTFGDAGLDHSEHSKLLDQAAKCLLDNEDLLIPSFLIPRRGESCDKSVSDVSTDVLSLISFNLILSNELRFRNCMLLLSAGMPDRAVNEFLALSSLTLEHLDSFFRGFCVSRGARVAYQWYLKNVQLIQSLMDGFEKGALFNNLQLFYATCMHCALADEDYGLAVKMADDSCAAPPYDDSFLIAICIVYHASGDRLLEACEWAQIAIENHCLSAYPFIVKIRFLLSRGLFDEAVLCLDQAESFCYVNGLKSDYLLILNERSYFMDNAS